MASFMQEMIMDVTITNLLGHLGYICIVIGMISLARKSAIGWLFRVVGDALWVIIGIILSMSSIWFWCTVFLVLDAYGYLSWRKRNEFRRTKENIE